MTNERRANSGKNDPDGDGDDERRKTNIVSNVFSERVCRDCVIFSRLQAAIACHAAGIIEGIGNLSLLVARDGQRSSTDRKPLNVGDKLHLVEVGRTIRRQHR